MNKAGFILEEKFKSENKIDQNSTEESLEKQIETTLDKLAGLLYDSYLRRNPQEAKIIELDKPKKLKKAA